MFVPFLLAHLLIAVPYAPIREESSTLPVVLGEAAAELPSGK
jgi:hypothetical protein